MFRTVLQECRDYLQYFCIPVLAIFLPWKWVMRLFHRFSYCDFLYRENTEACAQGAKHLSLLDDETTWKRASRVSQMIELADVFLLACRRESYFYRHVQENITDLLKEKSIIFFPHYGAGMWLLWYVAKQGLRPNLLVNRVEGRWTAYSLLSRLRVHTLKKYGVKLLYSDDIKELKHVLKNGETILVSPDMPVSDIAAFQPKTPLGKLNLMSQFFLLAERRNLPVISVVLGMDVVTGLREFNAESHSGLNAEAYAEHFAQLTAIAIQNRPYLWRMMVMAPQVMLQE